MSGPTYQVIEYPAGSGKGYEPRGAALQLWRCKSPECVIAGSAETGKTLACCHKLDALLWKYAGAQAVMLRKEYKTLIPTAYQTLRKKVHGPDSPITAYGGEKPEWLDYPNGSRLWLAGLDYPGKALSSERDFVYVNQCEELTLTDWGVLCSRATGRAGNSPYPQVMGDCNPGAPTHWIRMRSQEGRLVLLESRHEDNPTLWDAARRDWTEQGRLTLAALDALPGVLRDRLRYGRWVAAEGTVYGAWDARVHLIGSEALPARLARVVGAMDWGFTNPGVLQVWLVDGDGRMFLAHEVYRAGRLIEWWADQARQAHQRYHFEAVVCDPSEPAYIAQVCAAGVPARPGDNELLPGIQAVQSRLALAADGRPRLYLLRGALAERDEALAAARKPVCTADEFDVYAYPKGADGKPVKEAPVKVHDHGMDALRYACRYVDGTVPLTRGSIGTSKRSAVAGLPSGVFRGR
jgi:hypothetical protein